MSETTVTVGGPSPYDVVIGPGLVGRVPEMLSDAAQVAVIHPAGLRGVADSVAGALAGAGKRPLMVAVPDGEAAKSADVAASCWAALGRAAFTRSDAIVGVGGGATTDLAGFVAATWLRGVAYVDVPTTLLGMVDAAVGGKTGINTGEGKNLVGAFHPPAGVVCDLDALRTLPPADYAAGLAEVVKCGFIADPAILDLVEAAPAAAATAGGPVEAELVERAVRVKAEVVSRDLREATTAAEGSLPPVTGREALNYGHTLGHAIELAEEYRWRHGDAISVGMVFVAELARLAGLIDSSLVERHRSVLSSLGLPVAYASAPWGRLREAMNVDKKTRGSTLRLVVLRGLAEPVLLVGPAEESLAEAFRRIG